MKPSRAAWIIASAVVMTMIGLSLWRSGDPESRKEAGAPRDQVTVRVAPKRDTAVATTQPADTTTRRNFPLNAAATPDSHRASSAPDLQLAFDVPLSIRRGESLDFSVVDQLK
jgi:hypothetical protein